MGKQICVDMGIPEAKFREIESEVVKEASKKQNCVIATGGGAVLKSENIKALRQNGRLYFIDRPLSSLTATEDRPLSKNLQELYNQRYEIYLSAADKRFEMGDNAEQNAESIKEEFYNENTCC